MNRLKVAKGLISLGVVMEFTGTLLDAAAYNRCVPTASAGVHAMCNRYRGNQSKPHTPTPAQ